MQWGLLNIAMLAGLAGVSIPVLIHLLNRRRHRVVDWGAMQFLEVSDATRRRLRLEEMWLLLVRMLLIALLVLAMARPWFVGSVLGLFRSKANRDVVVLLDNSASMGYAGAAVTPRAAAQEAAGDLLGQLSPGDGVAVLGARRGPASTLARLTHDPEAARRALRDMAEPAGAADFAAGVVQATRVLSKGSYLRREIIIFCDGRRHGWRPDDESRWRLVGSLIRQAPPSSRPRVWVRRVGGPVGPPQPNWMLEPLTADHDVVARAMPVRLTTAVAARGQQAPSRRKVTLEVDGRGIASKVVGPIPPGGRVPVSFERALHKPGWRLAAVRLEDDHLAGDNRACCSIEVAEALPVLIVDGDRHREPWASEADFLVPALAPPGLPGSPVAIKLIEPAGLGADVLRDRRVAVLANVKQLTRDQVGALEAFVARGGGLLVGLGGQASTAFYNDDLHRAGAGLVGCRLIRTRGQSGPGPDALRVVTADLFHPALDRFRTGADDQLSQVSVFRWWDVSPPARAEGKDKGKSGVRSQAIAWLAGRRPWLLENAFGKGRVIVSTVPLDADWSDLPGKAAFVPLAHELIYYLAGASAPAHNLEPGEPIVARFPAERLGAAPLVKRPNGRPGPTVLERFPDHQLATYADTLVPGVYRLERRDKDGPRDEPYVVRFDRGESDLTGLADDDVKRLEQWSGLRFVADKRQLYGTLFAPDQQQELWQLVVVLVLLLLVMELWLTRRMAGAGQPDPAVEAGLHSEPGGGAR